MTLQSLVPLELDLLLGELIECLAVFDSNGFNLLLPLLLLMASLLACLLQLFLPLRILLSQRFLLVLEGCDLALLSCEVSCQPLDLSDELATLLVEFVNLLL